MPAHTPKPPNLATMNQPPSWTNRAVHTDRSACIELRASDIWPLTTLKIIRTTAKKREAAGSFTVTTEFLNDLHDQRQPRALVGDYRTAKSNAMKRNPGLPKRHAAQGPPMHKPGPDHGLTPNPNRGSSRSKILALPANPDDWSQPVRIERWRLHAQLAQHFLICPACKKKFLKLFLVMATPTELQDALLAHLWLKTHTPQLLVNATAPTPTRTRPHHPTLTPIAQSLIQRYHVLFPPRRLVCRHCLGLRYGEAKRKPQNFHTNH